MSSSATPRRNDCLTNGFISGIVGAWPHAQHGQSSLHIYIHLALILSLRDDFAFRRAIWPPIHENILRKTGRIPDGLEALSAAAKRASEARKTAKQQGKL